MSNILKKGATAVLSAMIISTSVMAANHMTCSPIITTAQAATKTSYTTAVKGMTADQIGKNSYFTTGSLNIRSSAGSSYSTIATAKSAEKLIVLSKTNSTWYKVYYGNKKNGYVGYCSAKYLINMPWDTTAHSNYAQIRQTNKATKLYWTAQKAGSTITIPAYSMFEWTGQKVYTNGKCMVSGRYMDIKTKKMYYGWVNASNDLMLDNSDHSNWKYAKNYSKTKPFMKTDTSAMPTLLTLSNGTIIYPVKLNPKTDNELQNSIASEFNKDKIMFGFAIGFPGIDNRVMVKYRANERKCRELPGK